MRRCVGAFRRTCLIFTDRILCDACQAEVVRAFNEHGPHSHPQLRFRPTAKAMAETDPRPPSMRRQPPIEWGQRIVVVPFRGDVS